MKRRSGWIWDGGAEGDKVMGTALGWQDSLIVCCITVGHKMEP
jgi:hypothetical protein